MRDTTAVLVERAQEAGIARRDVLPTDVMRLVHGLIMAENAAPGDEGQSERMLSLVVAGLLTSGAAGELTRPWPAPGWQQHRRRTR